MGEAEDQGVKVTDAEVKKQFDTTKKQSFPKEADFQKFLKSSGMTPRRPASSASSVQALSDKLRTKVTKGKDTVTDAQISDYYNKNKSRFAQPERRDLRIVLTKTKAKADAAKAALKGGQSFKAVAKKYSIDQASKNQGGKLLAVAKGQQEKALDDAVFRRRRASSRPGQDAVRLLRLRGHEDHAGQPADARRRPRRRSSSCCVAEPAEGAGQLRQGLPEALEGQDELPQRLRDAGLQERAEAQEHDAPCRPAARRSRRAAQRNSGATTSGG